MKALLEGGGSDLDHIVKVTVYLSNMARDFDVFNEIYADVCGRVSIVCEYLNHYGGVR